MGNDQYYPDSKNIFSRISNGISSFAEQIYIKIVYGGDKVAKNIYKCNPNLMASFNYSLNTLVSAEPQMVCAPLEFSCCGLKEQQLIEINLISGSQQKQIRKRLNFYKDVYVKQIRLFESSYDIVHEYLNTFVGSKVNNCYILAKQMSQFNIKKIKEEFLKILDSMYTFVEQAQIGSYCAVCDFFNHNKVKYEDNQIIYSDQFCREMIFSSAKPLLYLHDLFARLLNLSSQFYFECHNQGAYIPNPELKKWTLMIDESFSE